MKNQNQINQIDWMSIVEIGPRAFKELFLGLRRGSLPASQCALIGIAISLSLVYRLDRSIWSYFKLDRFYPVGTWKWTFYCLALTTSGFSMWAFFRAALYARFKRKLKTALEASGLKSRLGKLPTPIGDWPIDHSTRKIRLTNACLPLSDFKRAQENLEAALRIFIDEFREHRTEGLIDVIYSKIPIPHSVLWTEDLGDGKSILIGQTRSSNLSTDLVKTPHLLVAGQSGGGKSTFLRQLITSLYITDTSVVMSLVDLKGGLEFQIFEGLERIKVIPDIRAAISELSKLDVLIVQRMEELRESNCKDLEALRRKPKAKGVASNVSSLGRYVVVIDEASEIFLSGSHATSQEAQKAKAILSKIARQGRAVGIHLVIATQRPDSRALDPQVKANLTGVLCFQMANDASSMTVLGTGRATDLPSIPGRAIWKTGSGTTEVQTPFLSAEACESLLQPFRSRSSTLVRERGSEDRRIAL